MSAKIKVKTKVRTKTLTVFYGEKKVGTLSIEVNHQYQFVYAANWLNSDGAMTMPVKENDYHQFDDSTLFPYYIVTNSRIDITGIPLNGIDRKTLSRQSTDSGLKRIRHKKQWW